MRNLNCPQCEIHRFFVKNEKAETVLVTVDEQWAVVAVHPEDSLEGFDLTMLYCLGCSWKGSPQSLRRGGHKKHK